MHTITSYVLHQEYTTVSSALVLIDVIYLEVICYCGEGISLSFDHHSLVVYNYLRNLHSVHWLESHHSQCSQSM